MYNHGTALPCCGGYLLERDEMPLHDAAGANCKKGRNYSKSRLRCQVNRLRGVCWKIACVLSDYSLIEEESHGKLLLL